MRLVAIKDLKPGMKVAKNVQLDNGRLLILSGFIINSGYIRKLEVFNVPYVYIQEEEKVLEGVSEKKLYSESSDTIRTVMTSLHHGIAINSVELKEKVNDIVSEIIANDTVFMQLSGIKDRDNYTYLHSIDVCIYSLIAGKNLGLNVEELVELGISAALHDIGKSKVPMEVLMKPGKLTPEEFEQMKMHPIYSREIISSMKVFSERIADISSQHHEKLDGSGYPYGLKCRDIDFFARIISVADVYDAITADRVYKNREMPRVAANYIQNNVTTQFDPEVVEVFISNITIYNEGSLVLLSSGDVGRIIETVKGIDVRPKVSIIARKSGPPLIGTYEIDLSMEMDTEIVDILS